MGAALYNGQRQPAAAVSRNNVVLFYTYDSSLYKRLYPYTSTTWEDAALVRVGAHPGLTDQSGLLWLVWHEEVLGINNIYYATSSDGGRNFNSPTLLCANGSLASIVRQYDGWVGISYVDGVTGNVLYRTESNNFAAAYTVVIPSEAVIHTAISTSTDGRRIFASWTENETVKYSYSTDHGFTWSAASTLGTYTGITLLDLPTGHLLAIVEYHHTLYGLVSRDYGITWDEPHTIWLPEAGVDPCLLLDAYKDVVIFSSELNFNSHNQHTYTVRLRDVPFYAFMGEILDTWGPLNLS